MPRTKRTKLTATELKARAMKHATLIAPLSASSAPEHDLPFLGHPRAVVIVTMAANTSPTNLPRSLAQLGVKEIAFQKAVFDGVGNAGYTIAFDAIPDSPTTTLIKVVNVIQVAPKAA
jgi:hypothetical protein